MEKVKMTFSKFDELMEQFEAMQNTMHDYGLTRDDFAKMEQDPNKYVEFAMYLTTRQWYQGKGDPNHIFINHNEALNARDAAYLLNEFLQAHLELNDDEDDEIQNDTSDEEAMRKLLGLS